MSKEFAEELEKERDPTQSLVLLERARALFTAKYLSSMRAQEIE
jgi:hypothetical protein